MSLSVMSIILIGGLLLLLALGLEIFAAIGIIASIGLLFFVGQPLQQFAYSGWALVNSFELTAVPLFIFMGAIFANTGTITSLFRGADKLIGYLPGGVNCSVIVSNAIFGAISGSSVAASATFGKIAFPEMEKLGYNARLSLGSIAAGGTLSVLIPPSVIMVVYGRWEEVSVAKLFAAGLIPGLILAILLMSTVIILCVINPKLAPVVRRASWKERIYALGDIAPFAVIMILVLGVIFKGVMTPTEAAALGAFLSIILAIIYRTMTFSALKDSMMTAVRISAMCYFIMFAARVLGMVFQYIGLTSAFAEFMLELPLGKYGIFAIICVMYIILGMFFDAFSMMVLTLPFVGPLVTELGFSIIWFGVVYVVLVEIGLVTPPFGLNLFVLHGVVPKYDVMEIVMGVLPFIIPMLITIVILIAFPDIAMFLPRLLY